jgi:hypothetical protein
MTRLPFYKRIESVLAGVSPTAACYPRPNCRREDGLGERPKRGVSTDIRQHSVAHRPTAGIAGLGMSSLPLSTASDAEERYASVRVKQRGTAFRRRQPPFDRLCRYWARLFRHLRMALPDGCDRRGLGDRRLLIRLVPLTGIISKSRVSQSGYFRSLSNL